MKTTHIEISHMPRGIRKKKFDTDHGKWLRQLREDTHPNDSIEQIAAKLHITPESILRVEAGRDIPLFEATKLLEYYDPSYCSCIIWREN